MLRKRTHCRPVFDVRSKLDLNRRICNSLGVKYTVLINGLVKEIFRLCIVYIHICRRGKNTLVCRSCRDRTGIHKRNGSHLSVLHLRTFTVREVSGGMTDGKRVVCRCIAGPETWSAERSLYDRSGLHQRCHCTVLYQFHVNRCTCRIYT